MSSRFFKIFIPVRFLLPAILMVLGLSGGSAVLRAAEEIDILFVGDSITDRWDNGKEDREVWNRYFGEYRVLNIGVGGHSTAQCLRQIDCPAARNVSPRLIVLMIGTNDVGYLAMTPETAIEGNRKILAKLRDRWPNAVILHHAVFPSDPKDPTPQSARRQRILKVNEALPAMADGRHIIFLDFHDLFLDSDGLMHRETHPDLVHPNAQGYEIWGRALAPVVKEHLAEQ
ncbi:MAG: hypothetical protein J6A23_08810 [Thermoguttaceae bacterium]|nr:hypothetical protein [Thermoguttaceae bacterium]